MPPKKGTKKKKEAEPQEPEHDGSWEKAVETGVWELPPTSLPDANTWPTWGALRERILTAAKKINIVGSAAVRDAFLAELVKLSPLELQTLALRGSSNLSKAVISPATTCPKLAHLDLYGSPKLAHVLIQSQSLLSLNLSNCTNLRKAFIQCPQLEKLEAQGCVGLEVLMLWSDKLIELDVTESKV
ncbi:Dynein regulatory complex subunit 6 [Trebouxia sp. C0010 RCD-2024]